MKMLDPRVLWHGYSHLPEAGPREGIDEVRRWADAFSEAWGEIQVRVERLIEVDDQSVNPLERAAGNQQCLPGRKARTYTPSSTPPRPQHDKELLVIPMPGSRRLWWRPDRCCYGRPVR